MSSQARFWKTVVATHPRWRAPPASSLLTALQRALRDTTPSGEALCVATTPLPDGRLCSVVLTPRHADVLTLAAVRDALRQMVTALDADLRRFHEHNAALAPTLHARGRASKPSRSCAVIPPWHPFDISHTHHSFVASASSLVSSRGRRCTKSPPRLPRVIRMSSDRKFTSSQPTPLSGSGILSGFHPKRRPIAS